VSRKISEKAAFKAAFIRGIFPKINAAQSKQQSGFIQLPALKTR